MLLCILDRHVICCEKLVEFLESSGSALDALQDAYTNFIMRGLMLCLAHLPEIKAKPKIVISKGRLFCTTLNYVM